METQLKKLMTDWDYDKAVALARPIAEDWKKRTIEMARILYIANEQLNKKGKRTDLALKGSTKCNVALGSANKTPTWEDFCIEIGLPIRTAYDWLACYDPDKDLLLSHSEYKEARQELKKRNDPLIEEYSKRTIARIEEERQIASLAGICVGVKLAQVFSLNAVDEIVRYCACMVPDMDDDEDEEYEETEE